MIIKGKYPEHSEPSNEGYYVVDDEMKLGVFISHQTGTWKDHPYNKIWIHQVFRSTEGGKKIWLLRYSKVKFSKVGINYNLLPDLLEAIKRLLHLSQAGDTERAILPMSKTQIDKDLEEIGG